MSDPEVGSTSEAALHPAGTAASPMSVRTLKKPWLLRLYTRKRLLGCFIFQVIEGVALGILLIVFQDVDGLIIGVPPLAIIAGVFGIISYCLKEDSNPQTVLLLTSGILNRLMRLSLLAFGIKELYWSIMDQLYGMVAFCSVFILYVLILVVIDLTGICQAVRYNKALRHQSQRRADRLTNIMTFMAKKNAWTLHKGRLVPVNPDDEDQHHLLDEECTTSFTAPEA